MPFALPQNKSSRLMRYLYAIRQAVQIIIRGWSAPRSGCSVTLPPRAPAAGTCLTLTTQQKNAGAPRFYRTLLSIAGSNACQHFPPLRSISGCSVTLPALLSHFIKYCEEIRLLPLPAAAKHNRGWSAPRSGCRVTLPPRAPAPVMPRFRLRCRRGMSSFYAYSEARSLSRPLLAPRLSARGG